MILQEKCFSCYSLLTDQIQCLIACTSSYIVQYVYCSCLFSQAVTLPFLKLISLSNQAVFLHDRKDKAKT